jgi:hypothetical protein
MLDPRAARTRRRVRSERRRERRGRVIAWGLRLLLLAVVFFAGLVVGKALEAAPRPGGTETRVRTLVPGTVPPAVRTVTVTTGAR